MKNWKWRTLHLAAVITLISCAAQPPAINPAEPTQERAPSTTSVARENPQAQSDNGDPQLPKSFWWNTDSPFVGFRIVSPAGDISPEEIRNFWKMTLDE